MIPTLMSLPPSHQSNKLTQTPSPQLTEWKATNGPLPEVSWDNISQLRASRNERTGAIFESLNNPGTVINIPMRDGHQSPLRIYQPQPQNNNNNKPVIILLYGGGFAFGDNRQLAAFAIKLSQLYGVTVLLPTYRLAPENPFPTSQNDIWDTLTWLASDQARKEQEQQHLSPTLEFNQSAGFILGGVSAGANLSATLGQHWLDCYNNNDNNNNKSFTNFPLRALWLSIPLIFADVAHVPESYRSAFLARDQNAHVDGLNATSMHYFTSYLKADRESPLFSPMNSTNPRALAELVENGVRVYFQVAGCDPLRDDGLVFERILRLGGVETRLDVYPGVGFLLSLSLSLR